MNKTTNFDLPQWVKADQIKMDDFNGAFASIDAALKAEGDARSEADGTAAERITALAQTIANGKICRIKYGSYTGNGTYGAANAVSIECGFYPLLVMVSSSSSSHYWAVRGFDKFYYNNNRENEMTWGDTGVSWYYPQDDQYYPPVGQPDERNRHDLLLSGAGLQQRRRAGKLNHGKKQPRGESLGAETLL